ncbi:sugar kinase [Streptomyces sp. 6N223]|uniref:sugar kinase n=1 Tax=Streptomyces sp. 6N223 TaxID=3457412 RepID=UPI003FD5B4EB
MRAPRTVCVGEAMAQLAPLDGAPVEVADTFQLRAAGAESNVALGLRQLGQEVAWAGRIGDDALGRRLLAQLEHAGVGVDMVVIDRVRRTGLFIKSPGRESSAVTYYREESAGSALDVDDIEQVLACRPHVLHLSGVTPALSESCLRASRYAVDSTRRSGALVSFDVNYRRVLWEDREAAARVLLELASGSDIVFVGLDEARSLWPAHVRTAADVRALLPTVQHLVVKDGPREATEYAGLAMVSVPARPAEVIEPVGAGDAFAAGWLHGFLRGDPTPVRLRLGHLMAVRALTSVSDYSSAPLHLDQLHDQAAVTWEIDPVAEGGVD